MIRVLSLLSLAFLAISPAGAQPRVQTDFTAQDFQVRRGKIHDVIGDNLAIIQGATVATALFRLWHRRAPAERPGRAVAISYGVTPGAVRLNPDASQQEGQAGDVDANTL